MPLEMPQNRFEKLPTSPFGRLRELISDRNPGMDLIDMSIGEPKHAVPSFVKTIIDEHFEDFGRYPPIKGVAPLREAIANWLTRRFELSDIDPERHILPLNGTREGLFYAAFLSDKEAQNANHSYALMPNPFYLCYAAAALASGCAPFYLPATKETGHLPDLESLEPAVLEKCQLYYYCSPSNPQGAVADEAYQEKLLELSKEYNFIILADECYADIYQDNAPVSLLKTSQKSGDGFANIISFHSLSKRSNLPGLRSGFCAGDPNLIARFEAMRNVAGPQMPLPLQHASAAVWLDDTHVEQNRQLYRQKTDLADEMFASWSGYKRPDAGFFLWLDMGEFGGGTAATKKLWNEAGIRVIPGEYLSQNVRGHNPGKDYIRMALVGELDQTSEAFNRFKDVFSV